MNPKISHLHCVIGCVAFGLAMLSLPHRAAALVIDDFTQGGLTLLHATNYPGTTQLQMGLDSSVTIGGTRLVSVGAVGYIGSSGLATASIDPIKGRFHFNANAGLGYFKLDYGSVTPLNLDLTGGNNRFELEFVDTTPNANFSLFYVRVKSGGAWFNYQIQNDLAQALGGNTFGTLSVPFSKFLGVNFAAVQAIELDASRVPQGVHLAIESFTVVPEPSAAMLLLLAPVLMRFIRRHQRLHNKLNPTL